MTLDDLLVPAWDRGAAPSGRDLPLAFVDLDRLPQDWIPQSFPSFPVIGLGDSSHPAACRLDALIEAPVSAEALIRQVAAYPHAAAVVTQLLRTIENMPPESALAVESLAYGLLQGSGEHEAWLARQDRGAPPLTPGRLGLERLGDALELLIDRPAARNAIDRPLRDALFEAFSLAAIDPDILRIRLTGAGPAFSVGADLAEFGTTPDPATAHLIRGRTLPAHALLGCADKLEVHVRGACVGAGLEMAAFARRVIADADAWFQLPELAMGVLPGAGGCVSLSRRIGRQRTALMILSGRRINARTALSWGLVDDIAGDERGTHRV